MASAASLSRLALRRARFLSTIPPRGSAPPPPPPPPSDTPHTHFGFSSVPLSDKGRLVRNVFERVAPSYDVMNDAMSLAVHRVWKSSLVSTLAPTRAMRVLDCAGGTGDIAQRVLRARGAGAAPPVVVCDVNTEMLRVGRERARAGGLTDDDLAFVEGDAEALPFEDESFDVYVISFGMRNVPRPEVALAEAVRVLKPGGRFLMLEFAAVEQPALRAAYDAYSFNVIPALGQAIAGDAESYRYLVESIRQFPAQKEFSGMMRHGGLRAVSVTDYSFGIAALYSGFKAVTDAPPPQKL